MKLGAFLSSRIWLSVIAGLVGAMLAWTEASWRMTTPYIAGRVVAIDLALHQAAALVLVIFWLWIFLRRPDRRVYLDSRQALSAASLVLGAIALRFLLYYRILDPFYFPDMSIDGMTIYFAGLGVPLVFWLGLFFASRQYKGRNSRETKKESRP